MSVNLLTCGLGTRGHLVFTSHLLRGHQLPGFAGLSHGEGGVKALR